MNYRILMILFATAIVAGCQKKETVDPTAKVNITVTSPAESQAFHNKDTMHIKGNVDYVSELHGYEIKIEDTVAKTIVFDKTEHVHSDKFVIDESWVVEATNTATLKLSVIAYVDHDNDNETKVIKINVAP